jgi:hypothetical protein
MGEKSSYQKVLFENLKERDNWEDLGIDVTIILKCILKK